ncbi:XRE family transcriptional regulator [Bacillus clarus]|uniref:Helix-turn-helix family protein n=1 Tax=Bacillus clarus TaxID=2338372 RepID=A0A090YAF5_9BACI|nr:helix-turn-helix transcriptional regulator [Bacillus clarus]KFM95141.1 helix-turn-helix family protein [Bacillus clarus]RFT61548.1 XRE family transcriptional regulator [Bacillus clarus]
MIGNIIKELRKNNKLTQEQLGNAIRISKMAVSYFEKGKKTPSRETLEKIADYFNITTDYLLGRSDDPELTEQEYKTVTEEGKNILKLIENLPKEERQKAWEQLEMYVNYIKSKKVTKQKDYLIVP